MSVPLDRKGSSRRPGSLRRRLAALLAVTVAVVVLLVSGATYLLVAHQLARGQDVALLREATRIQRLIQTGSDFLASGSDTCVYASEPACTRVVTARDRVESGSAALHVTSKALVVARDGSGPAYYTVSAPGRHVRVVVLAVEKAEAVMVGIPTTTTDRTQSRVGLALILLGAVGILLSGLIGFVVAGFGLRPVGRLAESIDRVARTGDPRDGVSLVVDSVRNDELGRLSRSFTTMLEQLDLAQAAQRQLVADASHELRTPLTTLRTNIALLERTEGIPAQSRAVLQRAVGEELLSMQALVADLVDLARGAERQDPSEQVDLHAIVSEAVDAARRHWPGVTFAISAGSPSAHPSGVVDGSHARLERLVSVLLDNAGKYGGAARDVDGTAPVDVGLRVEESAVELTVADRGAGIPEDELERVFDRFYRSPTARSLPGSGLGLAIAQQIVAAHHGTISASRRDGGGTLVSVRLPVAG